MAEGPKDAPKPAQLSERIQGYKQEVQALIKEGVEHPGFEFKRSCSIARENLDDRCDFIKLIQGVANAEIAGERIIVIGADPKERQFYPVKNITEFDPATVNSILGKYLDPLPRLEVFSNLQTDGGSPFVVIVLESVQPRPILVKTEARKTDNRTSLQVGDIWVKRGTALERANRDALDSMYVVRMEEEAEDRARKRFQHFGELTRTPSIANPSVPRLPVRELLVGPTEEFRHFVEELIAANDGSRFSMTVELAREPLVEGWDILKLRGQSIVPDLQAFVSEIGGFLRDEFLPALQSLVTMGLLIVKYDFQLEWFQSVVDTILDAFEASRGLARLKSGYIMQSNSLPWWRPAFELYVAGRCLATYAIKRGRFRYLRAILPRMVVRLDALDRQAPKRPFLFWPLPSIFSEGEFRDGRSPFYWNERISSSWGKYFGTYENFLGAACGLEFLLEFNSYLGTGLLEEPRIKKWLETHAAESSFDYVPDLLAYDLHWTVPMAERCYDFIASDGPFPAELSVDPALFELAFKDKPKDQRLLIYGGFLYHLKAWQSQTMWGMQRMPFFYNWQGRLAKIADAYKNQIPKKA